MRLVKCYPPDSLQMAGKSPFFNGRYMDSERWNFKLSFVDFGGGCFLFGNFKSQRNGHKEVNWVVLKSQANEQILDHVPFFS